MLVFFDSVANIKRLPFLDLLEIFRHIESDAIEHTSGAVVNNFQFYMLKVFPDEFACAVIMYPSGAENRFWISGTEWIEPAQASDEVVVDVFKLEVRVDGDSRGELVGKYCLGDILLKSLAKLRNILLL